MSGGIDYKSNRSIGWSNDQFEAETNSGAVNYAPGYAGVSDPLYAFY